MSRKGENVYHRKDGRWEGRYLEQGAGACRRRSVYGHTYQEAKEKLLQARRQPPRPAPPGKEPFAQLADGWLAEKRRWVKASTYCRYRTVVEVHLKPMLGALPPAAIGQSELRRLVDRLSETLAGGTVHNVLSVLKMIFRSLAERGVPLPPVPCPAPCGAKKMVRVLSAGEYEKLARHLLQRSGAPGAGILLALECGLRIGEVCALRWRDFDFGEAVLTVRGTLQRLPAPAGGGTQVTVTGPKSASSLRRIPLRQELAALCRPLAGPADAFFLTGTPKPMEPQNLRYHLQRACAACGLTGVHFHTLRHTFATRCVEAGCEIKVLSEMLGHASTRITLDRYVHPSFAAKRANLERLRLAAYAPAGPCFHGPLFQG